MTFIALTIAGSDSGGAAGIQADLKTFSALGVFGASAVTAVTAQNTRAVAAVEPVSPDMVAAQIATVLDDLRVGAVKIGMLACADIVRAVAGVLSGRSVPIVLDPVMVAKSGDSLLDRDAVAALAQELRSLATLVTPNLPEAARLLGRDPAATVAAAEVQGRAVLDLGPGAVLMKGGHARGPECTDLLVRPGVDTRPFSAPRLATRNTHGTGCTLSAAITAKLALGCGLEEAVGTGLRFLRDALGSAYPLGAGRGPTNPMAAAWLERTSEGCGPEGGGESLGAQSQSR
jgi:hydroxymethylpyrimidine/phosphomethylpyrimidine kinase